ncbi:MAG: hypothetical protein IJQ90_03615 [Alphaproteobacteria bacterium]|nr:hypothetical protein [Alphaproteobacteria bacterium]
MQQKLKTDHKWSVLNFWRALVDDFRILHYEKLRNLAVNWNWALPMAA